MRWPSLVSPARNAGELQRHDFAVEQRHQPAQRTHEALGRLAAPVHVLRPVDSGNFFGQRLGKNLSRRAAFLLHRRGEIFALRRGDLLQRVDRNVHFACEGFGSGRRCSVFVRDLERRTRDLFADVGLGCGDAGGQDGQPARRGIGCRCRLSPRRSRCKRSPTRCASSSRAPSIMRAGISSVPISRRKSDIEKKQLAISD